MTHSHLRLSMCALRIAVLAYLWTILLISTEFYSKRKACNRNGVPRIITCKIVTTGSLKTTKSSTEVCEQYALVVLLGVIGTLQFQNTTAHPYELHEDTQTTCECVICIEWRHNPLGLLWRFFSWGVNFDSTCKWYARWKLPAKLCLQTLLS